MKEITRDVILDLLPIYIANEISEDSRELVKAYLESDAELAKVADRLSKTELLCEVPIPITKEHAMEAYQEAKLQQRRYIITLAAIVAGVVLFLIAAALAGLFLLIPQIWL
jgi:hypothetical protein